MVSDSESAYAYAKAYGWDGGRTPAFRHLARGSRPQPCSSWTYLDDGVHTVASYTADDLGHDHIANNPTVPQAR